MDNYNIHNELELFSLIAKGDEDAFSKIFHHYNSRLFSAVLKLVKNRQQAEEVIQELFLTLWLKRAGLPEIAHPGSWLLKIATNLALNQLKKVATYEKYVIAASPDTDMGEDEINACLDARFLKQQIAIARQLLPASRREVFILSREEGLTRSQIAERLGISESTVKNQLTAALKFIQNHIETHTGCYLPVSLLLLLY